MEGYFTIRLDWSNGRFDLFMRDAGPAPERRLIVGNLSKDQALALCGATIRTEAWEVCEQLQKYKARGNSQ